MTYTWLPFNKFRSTGVVRTAIFTSLIKEYDEHMRKPLCIIYLASWMKGQIKIWDEEIKKVKCEIKYWKYIWKFSFKLITKIYLIREKCSHSLL